MSETLIAKLRPTPRERWRGYGKLPAGSVAHSFSYQDYWHDGTMAWVSRCGTAVRREEDDLEVQDEVTCDLCLPLLEKDKKEGK